MISIPHTLLQRASSIVLALYVGAFLSQAFCFLHASHAESRVGSGMDGSTAYASSSIATHASPSTAAHALSSLAVLNPSQHGEHSGAAEPDHSGMCAAVACASALAATLDHDFEPMNWVSHAQVAYLGGKVPPDTEMVPPPPRLG